jgi:hypothetical protein
MNRISLLFQDTDWRPSVYICTSSNVSNKHWRNDVVLAVRESGTSFLSNDVYERVRFLLSPGDQAKVGVVKTRHGSEILDVAPTEWWSDDPRLWVSKFGSSMLVAAQIATWLGGTDLHFLGIDQGFRDAYGAGWLPGPVRNVLARRSDINHFSPNYGTPGFRARDLNTNMAAVHDLIARVGQERQWTLTNHSDVDSVSSYTWEPFVDDR